MKLIFFGSDDFAAVNLNGLLAAGFEVVACVTQPDRPQGRGLKVLSSPVKEIALKHRIPLLQQENLKDSVFFDDLKAFDSDLFVVIAYGKILPAEVLQIPRLFAVNVHGSLLPRYRGAAPINWAIINGDAETGISIIRMNTKMDAGEIIAQEKIPIRDDDTSITLRAKMADLSSRCLCRAIPLLEKGTLAFTRQDEQSVTFAPKLSRELGQIDWQKPAAQIHNLVRGMLSWSAAYTFYKKKMLKLLETSVVAAGPPAQPGEVVTISKEGISVATGSGHLLVKTVHPESGKPMSAQNFAAGHQLKAGDRFEV